jgi:hypothetical protein
MDPTKTLRFQKRTIVSLIQSPRILNRNIHEIQFFQYNPKSLDGSFQSTCVGLIKCKSFRSKQSASLVRFLLALGRERTIVPSSKAIFIVPRRLAMTNQNERVCFCCHVQTCCGFLLLFWLAAANLIVVVADAGRCKRSRPSDKDHQANRNRAKKQHDHLRQGSPLNLRE